MSTDHHGSYVGVDLEQRVTELEITLAHQNRLLDELNGVLVERSETIDALVADVQRLKEQLAELLRELPLENAKPPHY
jgi:SlyX protein